MAPLAAYPTTVKSGGTPTTLTNAATTCLTAPLGTVYQITNTANQILDPATAVVVEVDADGVGAGGYVTAAADTYTVNYPFGTITFDVNQGTPAVVRVSGKYIPVVAIAGAREMEITEQADLEEVTPFAAGDSWKRRAKKLDSASGTISDIEPMTTAGAIEKFAALRRAGTPVLLEFRPGNTGEYWRGWVVLENVGTKGSVEGILMGSLAWQTAPVTGVGQTEAAGFGWGT